MNTIGLIKAEASVASSFILVAALPEEVSRWSDRCQSPQNGKLVGSRYSWVFAIPVILAAKPVWVRR